MPIFFFNLGKNLTEAMCNAKRLMSKENNKEYDMGYGCKINYDP